MINKRKIFPILFIILFAGCFSFHTRRDSIGRFRPDERGRNPSQWQEVIDSSGKGTKDASIKGQGIVDDISEKRVKPSSQFQQKEMATKQSSKDVSTVNISVGRKLKPGDKLTISLRGIQPPEEISEVVDDVGCITLPLLGEVKVVDKTIPDAEREIEKLYIDGDYYRKITVIIVAQDEEFFIQGEVQRQGRFPISGEITLLQAIAMAGGFTDFAKETRIEIRRDNKVLIFNAKRIRDLKDKDPVIKPKDNIIVPRRWFL